MEIIKNTKVRLARIPGLRVTKQKTITANSTLVSWLKGRSFTIGVHNQRIWLADDPEGQLTLTKNNCVASSAVIENSFYKLYPNTRGQSAAYTLDTTADPHVHEGLMFYPLKKMD